MKEKPSIFIGSSSEGLKVAEAVKVYFEKKAEVKIWTEGAFKLNQSYLESLLNAANTYDFAILILTPDDILKSRGKKSKVARDNVVFEHGLFLGRLGPRRAFIICEDSVKILSDFAGITISKFKKRKDGKMNLAVKEACEEIWNEIKKNYNYAELSLLPSTALAIGYFENFVSKIYGSIAVRKFKIKDMGGEIRNDLDYEKLSTKLTIIIPEELSYVEKERLKGTIINKKLSQILVQTEFRDFPFYVRGNFEKENTLELFDIPTTLLSSRKAIELILPQQYIGENIDKNKLEKREIRNFRIVIEYLLKKRFGNDYKDSVRIEGPSFLDEK